MVLHVCGHFVHVRLPRNGLVGLYPPNPVGCRRRLGLSKATSKLRRSGSQVGSQVCSTNDCYLYVLGLLSTSSINAHETARTLEHSIVFFLAMLTSNYTSPFSFGGLVSFSFLSVRHTLFCSTLTTYLLSTAFSALYPLRRFSFAILPKVLRRSRIKAQATLPTLFTFLKRRRVFVRSSFVLSLRHRASTSM